jgi:hypothetical protein
LDVRENEVAEKVSKHLQSFSGGDKGGLISRCRVRKVPNFLEEGVASQNVLTVSWVKKGIESNLGFTSHLEVQVEEWRVGEM